MSRDPHEVINVRGPGIGDDQYPPHSAPNQAPQGMSDFVDGSGPIFSMYLEMATEEDKKMVENWKADADGILIFTGLFSAAVASLISVSVQDIRPNPQDTSNFYLANIYQTIANPNQPNISNSLPSPPPPFSPPNYAVWVNAFWFMSLVISLTCALLATLLQQWARRYLKVTQPRYGPHKRARIRAFFFEGVDKYLVPWVVDVLPTLLHVSLFLFFGGLAVFLSNVDLTIFKMVLSWVGVCTAAYGCITFIPIFRHDSPYNTPLTSLAWSIVIGISYVTSEVIRRLTLLDYFSGGTYVYFNNLARRYRKFLVQGMQKTAEETALNSPSEIDTRAFMWTFDSLDEDHELERFFSGLPGFRSSKVVNDPLPGLTEEQTWKLFSGLIGLSDRTSSSDLLPEPIKKRRAIICSKVIDPALIPSSFNVLDGYFTGPLAAEIVQTVGGWGGDGGEDTDLVVRAAVCSAIARVQKRDDSWFAIASRELGVPESVLQDYATHGDNLSLAVLIHVTRQQFLNYGKWSWPDDEFSKVLEMAAEFDVQDTSAELQHEFCALWNQIVLKVQNDYAQWMAFQTLGPIRNVYMALHNDTNSAPTGFSASTDDEDLILFDPTTYPVCSVVGHIRDDSASTTLPHIAALVSASLASPDVPSSPVPTPPHLDNGLMDVSPPDNNVYAPRSFDPAHHTAPENLHNPATSPNPPTTGAIRDVASGITIPHPAPKNLASAPASSMPPPASIALQHKPGLLTPSDPSNLLSSNPVLDNIRPTESHRSIIVTTSAGASPGPTSAPDQGAAAEDDGSPKPSLRRDKGVVNPPSVNHASHANNMATLELPPQSPSLPSATNSDVAIADPTPREPNAKRT